MSKHRQDWFEVELEGFQILVGMNARSNDVLTFREAAPQDLWLHAAGVPGSHVVIRQPSDADIPGSVERRAAELAAFHSKARAARGKVEVHICRAADVSKPRGAPPGTVNLRRFYSLRVYPKGVQE